MSVKRDEKDEVYKLDDQLKKRLIVASKVARAKRNEKKETFDQYLEIVSNDLSTKEELARATKEYFQSCLGEKYNVKDESTIWLRAEEEDLDVAWEMMDDHWDQFVKGFLPEDTCEKLRERIGWAMSLDEVGNKADIVRHRLRHDNLKDFCQVFEDLGVEYDLFSKKEMAKFFKKKIFPYCWDEVVRQKAEDWLIELTERLDEEEDEDEE